MVLLIIFNLVASVWRSAFMLRRMRVMSGMGCSFPVAQWPRGGCLRSGWCGVGRVGLIAFDKEAWLYASAHFLLGYVCWWLSSAGGLGALRSG